MKKLLVIGLAVMVLLMMAVPAVSATTFDVDGEGSGFFQVTTHIAGSSTLHDLLTVDAWDWDVDQSVYTGSFHIDRTVNMYYEASTEPWANPNSYTNRAEFLTTYDDGSTAITTKNFVTSTYISGHVSGSDMRMTQNYDTGSSVGSYVMASSGRFPTKYVSSLGDGSTFLYELTHTTTDKILDETWSSYSSEPLMDFGSGFGYGGQLNVYVSSNFTTAVDGLILLASVTDMFGFNPDIAEEVDLGTRAGEHIEFRGPYLDTDFSIPYGGTGHLNHEYYPVGLTIEEYSS